MKEARLLFEVASTFDTLVLLSTMLVEELLKDSLRENGSELTSRSVLA